MYKLSISVAKLSDLKKLIILENNCFTLDRIKARKFRYLLQKASVKIFVGKISQEIIASVIIIKRKESIQARIFSFAVHHLFRGQGVADSLLKYILSYYVKLKTKQIILEVRANNNTAIHFYTKNGFIPYTAYKNYYEDGENAIGMKKLLFSES